MIIRSHECVRNGFDRPFKDWRVAGRQAGEPSHADMLVTVFSASNYYGDGNSGAYLVLTRRRKTLSVEAGEVQQAVVGDRATSASLVRDQPVPDTPWLTYSVYTFLTQSGAREADEMSEADPNHTSLGQTLYDLVLANKTQLLEEFRARDPKGAGCISRMQWADVMLRVSHLHLQWGALFSTLVPPHSCSIDPNTGAIFFSFAALYTFDRFSFMLPYAFALLLPYLCATYANDSSDSSDD
jgi:hypothetical protein